MFDSKQTETYPRKLIFSLTAIQYKDPAGNEARKLIEIKKELWPIDASPPFSMHWRETSDLVVSGNPQLDRIEVSSFTNRETAMLSTQIWQKDLSQ